MRDTKPVSLSFLEAEICKIWLFWSISAIFGSFRGQQVSNFEDIKKLIAQA